MDKRVAERLEEYRKVLARVIPPSQVEAQLKVFADMCGIVPPETVLLSLEAAIEQMRQMVPQGPDRDIRELQAAYVCAAPTLEWWADRGRRGIHPESDARFLADCAEGLIQADADRLYAARKVLSERLGLDRSLVYGNPGRLAGAGDLARLPEPSGPGAPVPVAILPGGGVIEADFPAEGQAFWQEPRGFRVRLEDGETWSLSTREGVEALFDRFPLDITPWTLGTLLHWMLAPFPWETTIEGIGETFMDVKRRDPDWFREWMEKEAAYRQGEKEVDPQTLELFGAAPREGGPSRLNGITLKLRLPDGGLVLAFYYRERGGEPGYNSIRVEPVSVRYVHLVVENLPASAIKDVPATPEGRRQAGSVLHLDLNAWVDFFHLDGDLFVSERVRQILEPLTGDDVGAVPVVVQQAGSDAGGERRPYYLLDRVPRFATERRLLNEFVAGHLPQVLRLEGRDPEHHPTLFHTGLLVHDRVYDAFRDAGLTGMQADATGMEYPVFMPVVPPPAPAGIDDRRTAPAGLFRLTGHDRYDRSDYFVADYPTLDEAVEEARKRASVPNATPTSFSDVFFVHDDKGTCRFQVTHDDLSSGG